MTFFKIWDPLKGLADGGGDVKSEQELNSLAGSNLYYRVQGTFKCKNAISFAGHSRVREHDVSRRRRRRRRSHTGKPPEPVAMMKVRAKSERRRRRRSTESTADVQLDQ